ncbi:Hsp20/alpha crystallin family protein [Teladorsagia circumcincta]|uniref:Hsp20/alpha crystallin family protein n=1 Tax=Teladorsagia circumcincta TaxID=45464 RepID=A0A2G9U8D6_TELCI|nr:Hsp20/alpha crystallin family protein [Teladorsagia circumcincta]
MATMTDQQSQQLLMALTDALKRTAQQRCPQSTAQAPGPARTFDVLAGRIAEFSYDPDADLTLRARQSSVGEKWESVKKCAVVADETQRPTTGIKALELIANGHFGASVGIFCDHYNLGGIANLTGHIATKMSIPVEYSKDVQWDWPLQTNDDFVKVIDDSTHFEVDLDAKMFTPKEIQVKTVGDLLEIHMDHEARGDDTFNISRSITRCYKLPNGVNTKTLKSNLDKNGVLHISAMKS